MFESIPTYDKYRTLELKSPMMKGEDVFALQTALRECGFDPGIIDGIFGANTDRAVRKAQTSFFLLIDGKAGGNTQMTLAMAIATDMAEEEHIPRLALRGQLEHESGFRLGIYSPPRDDKSYDAGVAQRNTNFTPPRDGFDARASIRALAQNTRKYYDLFVGIRDSKRRWALAQGAWNAPAFACYIAKEEGASGVTKSQTLKPSDESRKTFETYVTTVSKYL